MKENKINCVLRGMDEDIGLVQKTLKNADNYTDLVKKYEQKIIYYIIRISGIAYEEAEDLAQEIFLKAYINLNGFDQKKKFSSWLFSIAHNTTISHWRKHKKRLEQIDLADEDLERLLTDEFDVIKKIDNDKLKQEIKEALARIDIKYREVLQLKYLNDYSYEEISDIIKKPVNTVGTLLSRAKKKLKKELANKKYD